MPWTIHKFAVPNLSSDFRCLVFFKINCVAYDYIWCVFFIIVLHWLLAYIVCWSKPHFAGCLPHSFHRCIVKTVLSPCFSLWIPGEVLALKSLSNASRDLVRSFEDRWLLVTRFCGAKNDIDNNHYWHWMSKIVIQISLIISKIII